MLVEHYSFGNLSNENIYFHMIYVNNEATIYEISKDKLRQLLNKPNL